MEQTSFLQTMGFDPWGIKAATRLRKRAVLHTSRAFHLQLAVQNTLIADPFQFN
jgi:hypothetical protein